MAPGYGREILMTVDQLIVPMQADDTITDVAKRVLDVDLNNSIAGHNIPGWQWDMLLAGLADAIDRYSVALSDSVGLKARIAIGEALWWIAAADDFLRDRISRMNMKQYYRQLTVSKDGRILAGLVYLRHRTGHQFALALVAKSQPAAAQVDIIQDDSSLKSNTVSATIAYKPALHNTCPKGGYYFAEFDDLPSPGQPEKMDRDNFYKLYVAGQAVGQILTGVEQSLRKVLSISQLPGNVSVAIKGDPLPRAQ
jgi:hypothetical protein